MEMGEIKEGGRGGGGGVAAQLCSIFRTLQRVRSAVSIFRLIYFLPLRRRANHTFSFDLTLHSPPDSWRTYVLLRTETLVVDVDYETVETPLDKIGNGSVEVLWWNIYKEKGCRDL